MTRHRENLRGLGPDPQGESAKSNVIESSICRPNTVAIIFFDFRNAPSGDFLKEEWSSSKNKLALITLNAPLIICVSLLALI